MLEKTKEKYALFAKALNHTRVGLVITDPSIEDNPIVYVNNGFLKLTGYDESEIVGQNCRFLQGNTSSKEAVSKIRTAIRRRESVVVQLFNYKKDGTGFWNELSIDPMWIEEEQKLYFVGVQKDVTCEKEKERKLAQTLDEMEKLSTPIVPVTEEIAVLPLIGTINDQRLDYMIKAISDYVTYSEEDYLIVDLSGLYEVDHYGVSSFLKLHQFISLMGKQLIVTGIRPGMALQASELQEQFKELHTFMNVKAAMKYITKS